MAATKVLLSGEGGNHSVNTQNSPAHRPDWEGVLVTIGPPKIADDAWVCGTDLMWPILDAKVVSHAGQVVKPSVENRWACRHQIIAGD